MPEKLEDLGKYFMRAVSPYMDIGDTFQYGCERRWGIPAAVDTSNTICIPASSVELTVADFLSFFWAEGSYDPDDIDNGLLRAGTILSTKQWDVRSGTYNYEKMFNTVIKLSFGLPDNPWAVETLQWCSVPSRLLEFQLDTLVWSADNDSQSQHLERNFLLVKIKCVLPLLYKGSFAVAYVIFSHFFFLLYADVILLLVISM
ncbi:hypothetical protein DFH07DRAFT_764913 [Mycena maculata]|uniref:Uncharacterized protein n=1 Tax=Mycena maculata TaxID=230809 RepID=A0AAD7KCU9_9AGAR|nr:hypothetical protein DFH07DRAFT_764913 [Mycena maculata]